MCTKPMEVVHILFHLTQQTDTNQDCKLAIKISVSLGKQQSSKNMSSCE